ncbi:MAG: SGNH/GDSL hydrolase family protein [Solirubrobacteraceae bacterium]
MRRWSLTCLPLAIAGLALALPGAASAKSASPRYYVALGDSLSQGMQPDLHGVTRNTTQGYADDLFARERVGIPSLQLVKLGCGGESTTSMLTGHGNQANARKLHCRRAGGSQLTAAVRFLRAHHHRGEVPLVTIDIGANDIDPCISAANLGTCVAKGLLTIKLNTIKILQALRRAAPAGTRFAGMTLYDPVLGAYFSPAGSSAHALALASPAILKNVNDELTGADVGAGFRTADVAGAFASYSTLPTAWEGQTIPLNVARVCSWTWACQTPPSGPNIHANKNGYQVIANAFAKVVGRLG